MSIYIIRPKSKSPTLAKLALTETKLTPESRQAQISEVKYLRKEDSVCQDIQSYIDTEIKPRGYKVLSQAEDTDYTQITGTSIVEMPDELAEQMNRDLPNAVVLQDQPIELIHPRRVAATARQDITESELWHLQAIGLGAARAQGFEGSGSGVTIAVLDTGIDPTHPELQEKVVGAYTFDVNSWQVKEMKPSPDNDGHGTHVAGLICGKSVGVAPGAKVINGIMIPGERGYLSNFVLAIEWASQQPNIQIVNMSAGLEGFVEGMEDAVETLLSVGVVPVFAVGNEGRNKTRSPGNYIDPISVGATDTSERIADFSSGGTMFVNNHQYSVPSLVAPGESVY